MISSDNGIRDTYIVTYTGEKFNPFFPDYTKINIVDIAHALSNSSRFAGHCKSFYSIAQHSLFVANLIKNSNEPHSMDDVRMGLLHDATEAYITDIPRPIKRYISGFYETEANLWVAIAKAFCLDDKISNLVNKFDDIALEIETEQLLLNNGSKHDKLIPLQPEEAERFFLIEFCRIFLNNWKDKHKVWKKWRES